MSTEFPLSGFLTWAVLREFLGWENSIWRDPHVLDWRITVCLVCRYSENTKKLRRVVFSLKKDAVYVSALVHLPCSLTCPVIERLSVADYLRRPAKSLSWKGLFRLSNNSHKRELVCMKDPISTRSTVFRPDCLCWDMCGFSRDAILVEHYLSCRRFEEET